MAMTANKADTKNTPSTLPASTVQIAHFSKAKRPMLQVVSHFLQANKLLPKVGVAPGPKKPDFLSYLWCLQKDWPRLAGTRW
jgi:ubiquinone/menaquinone biosynthesis C-methylase UbiE